MWKTWCKALGSKEGRSDKEADRVAIVRTIIFFTYLITNLFICANAIRHWNDKTQIYIKVYEKDNSHVYSKR